MAEFSATFLYFQTEENLFPSPESLLNNRESLKQTSSEGGYTEGGQGPEIARELHHHKNQVGTEERKSSGFISSVTSIHTHAKTEDEKEGNHGGEDNSQLSKSSASKLTGSSTHKSASDLYLQYKRENGGLFVFNCDFRHIPEEYHRKPRPNSVGDDVWTDSEFPLHDILPSGTTWVRADSLTERPVLFQTDLRFCTVLKGYFDASKFLVTFLTVLESEVLFSKVVQPSCVPEEKKKYDGVVHFRFWYFGQWVDVYVDDAIPVQEGCLVVTSHSAPFQNDIGITLAEKAYAKFIGSYKDMERMDFDEVFHGLTGGYAVQYKFRYPIQGTEAVYNKIRDALDIGAYIFCSVKSSESFFFGLGENLAFSIIGTLEITTYLNEDVYLLKLRNIWGDFEWTGPWSHGSSEWGTCPFDVYNETKSNEECFFYMDVKDFLQYFDGFTIGSLIPDFAHVGKNKMDYHISIYGEWRGPTAASFTNHLGNPKLQFTVSSIENHGEHFCDVGIILTQKIVNKEKPYGIHCSLLKVVDTVEDTYVVKYTGQKMEYFTQEQVAIRQNLCSGIYILVPSTAKSEQERQFLIRIFSDKALHDIGLLPSTKRLILCGEEGLYQENG